MPLLFYTSRKRPHPARLDGESDAAVGRIIPRCLSGVFPGSATDSPTARGEWGLGNFGARAGSPSRSPAARGGSGRRTGLRLVRNSDSQAGLVTLVPFSVHDFRAVSLV